MKELIHDFIKWLMSPMWEEPFAYLTEEDYAA